MMRKLKDKVGNFIGHHAYQRPEEQITQVQQVALLNQYRLMKKVLSPEEMPSFEEVGFRVHSQFEEDGILLYIFALIGTTNKKAVEICAGNGRECMAANLIINHGWHALLFDGSETAVADGNRFFGEHPNTFLMPPVFKCAWITVENINDLIAGNGFEGTIDLLSLDIDGNDYHIMKAITVCRPRVIICETHNVVPGDKALTVPYKPDFNRMEGPHPEFMSVSLLAMKKLLGERGYRLIGAHRHGFNAVFMLEGVGEEYFPEVSIEAVHDNDYTRFRQRTAWPQVKDLPWLEV